MSEYTLQFISVGKLFWVALFALLYGLGGISNKWLRRYLGAAWISLGVFLFSRWGSGYNWLYLTYLPALIACLSMGYGGDTLIEKMRKRAIYGLLLGIAPLALVILNNAYQMWALHTVLCITVSVSLGVFNFARNAREEETLIGTLSTILPLYMI